MKKIVCVTLSEEMLTKIDHLKGVSNRSKFVEKIIKEYMDKQPFEDIGRVI